MAITTKNMKSIQYPYMPEEGMVEEGELKIHQASHSGMYGYWMLFMFFVVIAISTFLMREDASEMRATFGSKSHFIMKTNDSSKYFLGTAEATTSMS